VMGTAEMDVDIEALRAKYSRPREVLLAEARAKEARDGTPLQAAAGLRADKVANLDKLNEIVMCQACQALGTVKKQYGFRVLDEECGTCGGEGIIRKGQSKLASEELCEKVKRVEALVAAATDLEELERLEAALNERTLSSLDAVLRERAAATADVPSSETAVATAAEDDVPPLA